MPDTEIELLRLHTARYLCEILPSLVELAAASKLEPLAYLLRMAMVEATERAGGPRTGTRNPGPEPQKD